MASTRTLAELQMLQALPLEVKIRKTQERLREWVDYFGLDGVYVSFSGGKDSTVLLTIARQMYPGIKAVFVDTGLEFPEIRQFVKTWDNVDWIKPKRTFKEVVEKYGYPFISKEVSACVYGARKYLTSFESEVCSDRQTDRQTDRHPYAQYYRKVCGIGEYRTSSNGRNSQESEDTSGRRINPMQFWGGYDRKYRKCRGIGEFTSPRRAAQESSSREYVSPQKHSCASSDRRLQKRKDSERKEGDYP